MSARTIATIIIVTSVPAMAEDDDRHVRLDEIEELVVTAPFREAVRDTALPVGILSGEKLRKKIANSVGETLRDELGVHAASFGPGVGLPIIRGQSGNRVQVLSNGSNVSDAATVSPDHGNAVDAVLANRIEVLRGPATLLYGNGAIGGVVNVVDGRVPEVLLESPEVMLELTHETASGEERAVFRVDASSEQFGFYVDGYARQNKDIEINGFAVDESALEMLEALHDDADSSHEEDDIPNTNGFIANSVGDASGGSVGMSWIGDRSFIGLSVNYLAKDYGLPPGTHEHHDEEEHGEEEHEEEEHEEEEEGAIVRLDMEQTRYDLRGGWSFDDHLFEEARFSLGVSDYEHREIEKEGSVSAVGTVYSNKGVSGRMTLTQKPVGVWDGVIGFQFGRSDFSALGEEAFISITNDDRLAMFAVERFSLDAATIELGARLERTNVDPVGRCKSGETTAGMSASTLYDYGEDDSLLFALSLSERSATIEELYSNIEANTCNRPATDDNLVLHAATGIYEIGNPSLSKEVATNIELGIRHHAGPLFIHANGFLNRINDYIFLAEAGEFEDSPVAAYAARDARFYGAEMDISFPLIEDNGTNLSARVFGDVVRASFSDGGNVPRMPGARVGAELQLFSGGWSFVARVTRLLPQTRADIHELPTGGYTRLSLYGDHHVDLGARGELSLFLRANNLLDEAIRDHTSFLKNYAPAMGRSIQLGVRYRY